MSSLWTPGGEHEVPRDQPQPQAAPPQQQQPAADPVEAEVADMPGFDELTPEQQAQAREMAAELAEARERIAETPAAEIVANHAMGIYELADIHLTQQPPNIEEGRLAIDGLIALLGGLEGRLGEAEGTLREAVGQIQMAFVQLQSTAATE